MKRKIISIIEIIIGAFFILLTLGALASGLIVFGIILFIIGALLIVIGVRTSGKARNNRTSASDSVTESPATEPITRDVPPIIRNHDVEGHRPYIDIPKVIDNLVLVYCYINVAFKPCDSSESAVQSMKADNKYELSIVQDETSFCVEYNNTRLGTITDRVDMVRDWLKRNDLIRSWLTNYGESGNTIALAFYRDEQARLSYRETSVVKLTRCYNEEMQDMVRTLQVGEKLDLEESSNWEVPDGTVEVTVLGALVGALPKKAANRYLDEGAAAAFVDHIDYDYEKDKDIPYIKIYW